MELIFGITPPVMSDFMQQAVEIQPNQTETKLIREILLAGKQGTDLNLYTFSPVFLISRKLNTQK